MAKPAAGRAPAMSERLESRPTRARRGDPGAFRVVGIGASAGGLEAIEGLLRGLPPDSGLAYVVVQHLDPTHEGMLVELLQRATSMPVLQVKDRLRAKPNHVHVIPPNTDLSILNGVFHLLAPTAPRGQRLPIDYFLRSLAADQKANSIGVILSGMGSDGSLGISAIKAEGGAVFVQAPESAKFDAMPRHAIETGLADVVGPVDELAMRIVAYHRRTSDDVASHTFLAPKTEGGIDKICVLLRSQTGHDFSLYKRTTIYRRIERRMGLHQIDKISAYVRYLQENPQELTLLFKELLIGVTSFFRDSHAWEHLAENVLPTLLADRPAGGVLRAWVPGCSTGEEAYSLAMVFKEALARLPPTPRYTLQIFGTDLDADSIDRARAGLWPASIANDVSPERLARFFSEDERGYRITQEIREMVIFATQNVIMDPPFTKLDILSCRNLLIYLTPGLQKKLLALFHYSLNPGGILFLGSSETLGTEAEWFADTGGKTRIYRRLATPRPADSVEFPPTFHARALTPGPVGLGAAPRPSLQPLADRLLLERYSPAALLTNSAGDILYISGHTGKYLEPAAGKANWNIHAMAHEGLRHALSTAFRETQRTRKVASQPRVTTQRDGAGPSVELTVELLQEPEALRNLVLVVFTEPATITAHGPRGKRKKLPADRAARARLSGQLQQARDELRTTREDMQTSQEEIKSANEELQSTNEELQSTNEELTTSKEEMQSMNEELQTLNHELQAKVDELSHANDDMRNLLDSTDIATLFLDNDLRVRRFTPQMTRIIKLIPGDVNRPITDLASGLQYPELVGDARAVLKTLAFKERPVTTADGHWFAVRIMPYRTVDNRIDGVVITFVDISAAKTLEARLRRGQTEGAE